MSEETRKPSHSEWLDWAQVVVDRLTTCVRTYSRPPYDDVHILEKERQSKNEAALNLLRRTHAMIDETDTPTESLAEVALHDERRIDGIALLFRETLDMLPTLSADMQKLLKSEWYDKCHGRVASELFRGPMGDLPKGIGSGYAEQGRLPAVLAGLVERERIGDNRVPRKDLHRHEDGGDDARAEHEDIGPERRTIDVRRRWADKNGRSSGAVE